MPSAHRRVGLVVDDDVDSALVSLRRLTPTVTADATLVRMAVLDGAVLQAIIAAAASANEPALMAVEAVRAAVVDSTDLPQDLSAHVLEQIDEARSQLERSTRRTRQHELLRQGAAHSAVALELRERLDRFDPLADG
jgi:hypothetical protein